MDCSLPGSSVHGIFQAAVLEWVAVSFSRGSSQPWDWTQVSCVAGRHFTVWATKEAQTLKKLTLVQIFNTVKFWFCFLPIYINLKHCIYIGAAFEVKAICVNWDLHILFIQNSLEVPAIIFPRYPPPQLPIVQTPTEVSATKSFLNYISFPLKCTSPFPSFCVHHQNI